MDSTPDYIALSYTWEGQVPTEPVSIDGRISMITKNLHDALFTLRDEIRDKAHGFVWNDSTCINQQDDIEKSSQVALMMRIYSRATCVFAWLGMPSNGSDFAMARIRITAQNFFLLWRANESSISTALANVNTERLLLSADAHGKAPRAWPEVAHLLRRTWFTRAWVIQEVSRNKQVIIFWGSKGIDLEDLCLFLVTDTQLATFQGNEGFNMAPTTDRRVDSLIAIRLQVLQDGGYSLLEALHKLSLYNCAKGHDKVYAALGLVRDLPMDAIRPDYSKSVVEVYVDVVRYYLGSAAIDHQLDFLGMILRPAPDLERLRPNVFGVWLGDESDRAPTWVPDWRMRFSGSHLPKTVGGGEFVGGKVYDASKGSETNVSIENRTLLVKGIFVDYIASNYPIVQAEDFSFAVQKNWRPLNSTDEYPTGETVDNAFLCTLVADAEWHSDSTAAHRGYSADLSVLDVLGDLGGMSSNGAESLERNKLLFSILCATTFHRFIQTEKGYMGLAPAAAAVGDKICVLFGGQVLYVLRQNKDVETHEFIGECYVHGLMDGQAMDMPTQDDEAKPEPEMFVLV
jgi:hypothetical protein